MKKIRIYKLHNFTKWNSRNVLAVPRYRVEEDGFTHARVGEQVYYIGTMLGEEEVKTSKGDYLLGYYDYGKLQKLNKTVCEPTKEKKQRKT